MAVTSVVSKPAAPLTEIGYAQAPAYNWWQYQDETTPELMWPQSISVYDAMRRTDAQVTSVLRAMTLPVRSTPWRIDPNGASDEVTEFVADNLGLPIVGTEPKAPLRQQDRFSWDDHLRQALLMLPYGHMYFEQVYRVDPDGRARLRKLGPRMPKTIERIDVADDGGLISITQYWTQTNSSPRAIPANRLVAYIHEKEGGNWLGSSILRPGYKNWLLKDRLLRVWAQTIERNGMGVPRYTGADGEASLAQGLAMAKAWRSGESAGTAIPFGSALDLVGVNGTLPDAEPAVRYHDEQLGRAVLAHFLNLGTQTGSWALGTTFADFFTLSLQSLAQQVMQVGSLYIIEDLVDVNWGPDEPAPKLVCDEIGSRQPATAQSLVALFGAGALTPDDRLEESLRQQYGLPPKDPDTTRGQDHQQQPAAAGDPFYASAGGADPKALSAGSAGEPVAAGHPYPGQHYRHGWIPVALGADPLGIASRSAELLGPHDVLEGSDRIDGRDGSVVAALVRLDGEPTAFLATRKAAAVDSWVPSDEENSLTYIDQEIATEAAGALDAVASGRSKSKEVPGGDIGDIFFRANGDGVDVSVWSYPIRPDADAEYRKDRAEERRDLVKEQKSYDPADLEGDDITAEGLAQIHADQLVEFDAETASDLAALQARRDAYTVYFTREQASALQAWLRDFAARNREVTASAQDVDLAKALIVALAEFTGEVQAAAGFTEALHPRDSQGQFRNVVDRILHALGQWSKGSGSDDPLPASVFTREHVRKAALHRGITLKRGASREDIVKALKDDVRAHVREGRDRQAVEGPKRAKFTLQGDAHAGKDVAVYRDPAGHPALFEESDTGKQGKLVQRFDSLDEMATWAEDNGEPRLAEWARKEGGGKGAPTKAPGYHVGFTGTRSGMTPDQKATLRERLAAIKAEHGDVVFHYGQAVGADEEAATIARELGLRVVSHPSNLPNQTSARVDVIDEARTPRAPLARNRDIVAESDIVLATPRTRTEEQRSGTWATIRHADKTGVAVERILPTGSKAAPAKRTPRPAAPKADLPDASDPEALRDALDLRTVPELKAMIKAYNDSLAPGEKRLPVSGRKRDLVDRLVDAPGGKASAPKKAAPAAKGADLPGGADIELAKDFRDLTPAAQVQGHNLTPAGQRALDSLGAAGHPRIAAIPDTEGKIRESYRMLALPGQGRDSYVALEDVRKLVGEQVPRAEVDDTLRRMWEMPDVQVVPQSYDRQNMAERLPAAIMIGGQEQNLLHIDDPTLARPKQFPAVDMAQELVNRRDGGPRHPMMVNLSDAELRAEVDRRMTDPITARDVASEVPGYATPKATRTTAGALSLYTPAEAKKLGAGLDMTVPASRDVVNAEARRRVETVLDDVDEMLTGDASDRALLHRLDGRRKLGAPASVVDELEAAVRTGDRGRLRQVSAGIRGRLGPAGSASAPPPRTTGRDISTAVDYQSLPEYNLATNHDDGLREILRAQGFDGAPQVVSQSEFDAAVKRGEVRETWRGLRRSTVSDLTPEQMAEAFRTGDLRAGIGINGNGTYVAMRRADAEYYAPTLLRIGLRKDARVISADDLDAEMDAYFAAAPQGRQHRALEAQLLADLAKAKSPRTRANLRRQFRSDVYGPDRRSRTLAVQRDPGRFAALRGYDAIEIPKERSPDKHAEMIILNRTATIVQQGDAPGDGGAGPKGEATATPSPRVHDLFTADDATVEAALKDVFEGQFGPYTTKVTVSLRSAGTDKRGHAVQPSITVEGGIYDAQGNDIGYFSRSITPVDMHYADGTVRREVWADHQVVQLGDGDYSDNPTKYHGKGFGGEFNRRAIEWYRASGVHGIGQDDHNGYVWASQGFNFGNGGTVPDYLAENIRGLIADLRAGKTKTTHTKDEYATIPKRFRDAPDLDAQIAAAEALLARLGTTKPGDPGYPTAYEISQLGRKSGQRGKTSLWLGKLLFVSADQLILNPDEGEVISQ